MPQDKYLRQNAMLMGGPDRQKRRKNCPALLDIPAPVCYTENGKYQIVKEKEMKHTGTKVLAALLLLCVLAGTFAACGNAYGAVLYSHAEEWIKADYLTENRVQAYYPNAAYETDPTQDAYLMAENAPKTRTLLFTDKASFEAVFSSYPVPVNFAEQMVLLHIFPNIYPQRDYFLSSLTLQDGKLTVRYRVEEKHGVGDAAMPVAGCLFVRMQKTDVQAVEFIKG